MENSLSGKSCLVTGGSGFIGSHLTEQLIRAGARVRVLVRKTSRISHLASLSVEKSVGDILDIPSLQKAMEGVNYLFHVAGLVAFGPKDASLLRKINVQGVRNALGVAQDLRIKRVILTSSVASIGGSLDKTPRDENSSWDPEAPHSAYSCSKHDGEMEAMKFYREGLPLVVVNPSFVIGSPDDGPSVGGKVILSYLKGKIKAYLSMGLNLVDVKDVARGHILAAIKGRIGERYILANENKMLIEFLRLLEKASGVKAPRICIPRPFAYLGAAVIEGIGKISGRNFPVTRAEIRRLRYFSFFSHEKAARELGYAPRPLDETLSETVRWFRERFF